ncbi:CBO0543 family protein [Sporomusa sp.]|uniref:CBO0543 family protein n=1 Tax=Sporomusa sp. TaxID=2078658 RepID=UPI0039C9B6F7
MRILLAFFFVLAAWKWANWRNWKEYYPTILFMFTISLLVDIITANHKLWLLTNDPFTTSYTANGVFATFTMFPAKVLLYLSNFPKKSSHKIYYILAWIIFFTLIELGAWHLDLFIYDHGWSLAWSLLFNCVMVPLLWIHHHNPLLAWALSAGFITFIWTHFGFYIELLK